MNIPLHFTVLTCLMIFVSGSIQSQHRLITLQCDSNLKICDTLTIEHYDEKGRLELKERKGSPGTFIHYFYNNEGHLILKEHQSPKGETVKRNLISVDSSGRWTVDSLVDARGGLLTVFKRTPLPEIFRFQVEWFFKGDDRPGTRQIIQEDSTGRELSNSTCYDNESCLTYLFYYFGSRKTRQELWVLQTEQGQPLLQETEEFYYHDATDQPAGSVLFLEPEHRATAYFRYVKSVR